MRTLCLILQLHQPFRLKRYHFFDIGRDGYYYDDFKNKSILRKAAEQSYLPTNALLLELIKQHGEQFKVSLSLSGTVLDQLEIYAPEVIESFQALAQTGQVEFLSETYGHSLASLTHPEEFAYQVRLHARKINRLFGQSPRVFRNTEMVYNDRLGEEIARLGFEAVLTEGADHVLGWRSPHFVYFNPLAPKLKVLLRHYPLSDDIAFRFSDRSWNAWPLTTEKYAAWINSLSPQDKLLNLVLSYETFGTLHQADSGIFDFLRYLPPALHRDSDFRLATLSEALQKYSPKAPLAVPDTISWADAEKDLTAWLGNEMQDEAFEKLYKLRPLIEHLDDKALKRDWMYLQTSDHFYYMSTKFQADGEVHNFFNPYESPYEAFINYMNVLSDFILRLEKALPPDPADRILLDNGSPEELEMLVAKSQALLAQWPVKPVPTAKETVPNESPLLK
ncbi:MAG: glycoside hydrolase family 57 protein [Microscillaceae bacterium]